MSMDRDLEEKLEAGLEGETSEMGEVAREFNTNHPSSSNLTKDEHTLSWRGKNMLKNISPTAVEIINDFLDSKRSVGGWNTDRKVEAITGIHQQRSGGGIMEKLFANKGGGQ